MKPVFKEGHKKKGGRKKGIPNKITGEMRELAKSFCEDNWETIQTDFDKLKSPKDRLYFRLSLLEFAIGKMQRVEHVGDSGGALQIEITKTIIEKK